MIDMKKIFNSLLAGVLVLALAACSKEPQVKYVFYLIGDGMGINSVTGAGPYNEVTGNGPAEINFNGFPVRGFITTRSATSLVTDSAAAGTALASGKKTYTGAIGVDADTVAVALLTECAMEAGYGVGVATTVGVNHATPASFLAHTPKRRNYEAIATQYIDSKVDFAAGAGFITEKGTGHDGAYFEEKAREAGITVFHGPSFDGIASATSRVLCLSGKDEEDLPYAIDRKEDDTTLSDFVQAGIDYLDARFGKKGFFFMIEGGKIDYAGHGNDGACIFREVTDFAEAVDRVLAFYEKHPDETLIVVTADHETGGLMLGAGAYEMHPDRLSGQRMSLPALTALFRDTFFPEDRPFTAPGWEQVQEFFRVNLGLWDQVAVDRRAEARLHETYEKTFGKGGNRELSEANLYAVNSKMVTDALKCLDEAAGYAWPHGSHSGSPVGLYVKGKGQEAFVTVRDNTEIAPLIARLAGYPAPGRALE